MPTDWNEEGRERSLEEETWVVPAPTDFYDRLPIPPWCRAEVAASAYTQMGIFYTTDRVCDELGMSRQDVEDQAADGAILRAITADGAPVYPAFQFIDGNIDPNVSAVVQQLTHGGMDPWSILHWLQVPDDSLDGSAADALLQGRDVNLVGCMAADDLTHWIRVDEGLPA